jgi:hypothetical protein
VQTGVTAFDLTNEGRLLTHQTDGRFRIDNVEVWQNTKEFLATSTGVYWLGTSGEFKYLQYGGNWQTWSGNVADFDVTPDGRVLTKQTDNSFRIDNVEVWQNTKEFLATSTGVYWLGTSGEFKYLQYGGNWQTWATDAADVVSMQAGMLGEIYLRRSNGQLRRYYQGQLDAQNNTESFSVSNTGDLSVFLKPTTIEQEIVKSYPAANLREILTPSNTTISSALINPVGKVSVPGSIGSGTHLELGIVITAKHVVEGFLPSQVKFTSYKSGSIFSEQTWSVTKIVLHPTQDIALLKLSGDTRNLPKASLPNPDRGWFYEIPRGRILLAGYGYDGDGFSGESAGSAGVRRYGFATVDRSATFPNTVGAHWVNVYRQGESAFAHGDSGGPDIVPYQYLTRPPSGTGIPVQKLWAPVIVGIHSFVTRPTFGGGYTVPPQGPNGTFELRYGDEMWSVAITPSTVTWYFQQRPGLIFSGASGSSTDSVAEFSEPVDVSASPNTAKGLISSARTITDGKSPNLLLALVDNQRQQTQRGDFNVTDSRTITDRELNSAFDDILRREFATYSLERLWPTLTHFGR